MLFGATGILNYVVCAPLYNDLKQIIALIPIAYCQSYHYATEFINSFCSCREYFILKLTFEPICYDLSNRYIRREAINEAS